MRFIPVYAPREVPFAGRSVFRDDTLLTVPWSEVLGELRAVTAGWPH